MSKIELSEHCRILKNYIFFLNGPFCQWWKSKFMENDIEYNCCEQYMMYQKAILFKDEYTAKKILESKEPREQKRLGRLIKNFNEKIWDQHKEKIVANGNYLKFSQNEDLKEYLISSKDYTLVEANKYDRIWGIGMYMNDPNILDTSKWGQNLLGKTLMKVREIFVIKELVNAAKAEQAKNEDYKEKYTYLLAEFENYRKRIEREKYDLIRDSKISVIEPFLQIYNFLNMAKTAIEKSDNIDSIKVGIDMIVKQYDKTLEDLNISKIKYIILHIHFGGFPINYQAIEKLVKTWRYFQYDLLKYIPEWSYEVEKYKDNNKAYNKPLNISNLKNEKHFKTWVIRITINKCYDKGKLTIITAEFSSYMTRKVIPNRAEVSDLSTLVSEAVDGIMLTSETTVGTHPIETVKTVRTIIKESEDSIDYSYFFRKSLKEEKADKE